MRDTRSYDQRKMDEARERERTGNTIACNDRTDYPEYRQTRRCVGQCTPDRGTLTAANDAMSAASSAANFILGMVNPNTLGWHDPDEELDQYNGIADRRRAGEAAYQEQQRLIAASKAREEERAGLMGQLSDVERGIYLTHLEANAFQPGSDTLTPMNLGRDADNRVVQREAVSVENRRLR